MTDKECVDGRDKFCKMIQYGARFMKYQAEGKNESAKIAFAGLLGKIVRFDDRVIR